MFSCLQIKKSVLLEVLVLIPQLHFRRDYKESVIVDILKFWLLQQSNKLGCYIYLSETNNLGKQKMKWIKQSNLCLFLRKTNLKLILQLFFHITIFQMKNRLMYERVQTASPQQRIHIKHQEYILKQIKTMQIISRLQPRCQSVHTKSRNTSSGQKPGRKKKLKHYSSDLEFQLAQVQKIRGKQPKPKFSFSKDEQRICKSGWIDFGSKVERKTQNDLKNIRKKANFMLNRATVSNICIMNGVNKIDISQESLVAQQKIKNIWNVVKGTEVDDKYFKISNLNRDVKNSVVLGNAYKLCLHSKNYKSSTEQDFNDEKFKSFVYLNENMNKLPKKKMQTLLKNNSLIK